VVCCIDVGGPLGKKLNQDFAVIKIRKYFLALVKLEMRWATVYMIQAYRHKLQWIPIKEMKNALENGCIIAFKSIFQKCSKTYLQGSGKSNNLQRATPRKGSGAPSEVSADL
jgi:hypothetical protein